MNVKKQSDSTDGREVRTVKVLRGRRGRIMRAIMNAIIPRGGRFDPGAHDYDLIPRAEEILMGFDPMIRMLFPLILAYVQVTSIVRTGRTFTSLPDERGAAFLDAMESSPFYYRRMMMLLLKLLTMLTFYEIDENAAYTGYEHGCCINGRVAV